MKPIIKWTGGKTSELKEIVKLIPKYNRYIEPFFGGGAVFFHLAPQKAIINDISPNLMDYYKLIKAQDECLYNLLIDYNESFHHMLGVAEKHIDVLYGIFYNAKNHLLSKKLIYDKAVKFVELIEDEILEGFAVHLILDRDMFIQILKYNLADKIFRTVLMYRQHLLSNLNINNNLVTGLASGYYMYYRKLYNDINLNKVKSPSLAYKVANFYFIREYCYGAMFRYNSEGEFNIPYGGISYNKKHLKPKINEMFNQNMQRLFQNTDIYCMDFEIFLTKIKPCSSDFIFLDPPYDTKFSSYDNRDFNKFDQERLACLLKQTVAKFILIIQDTPFIKKLYTKDFNIVSFDKLYRCNIKGRNPRNTRYLIVSNMNI